MKAEILEYCLRSIVRHMNGDIEEFERLANKAYTHYQLEAHMFFKVGDVIPASIQEAMYKKVVA